MSAHAGVFGHTAEKMDKTITVPLKRGTFSILQQIYDALNLNQPVR